MMKWQIKLLTQYNKQLTQVTQIDGKIFVIPVENVVKIKTNKTGSSAV